MFYHQSAVYKPKGRRSQGCQTKYGTLLILATEDQPTKKTAIDLIFIFVTFLNSFLREEVIFNRNRQSRFGEFNFFWFSLHIERTLKLLVIEFIFIGNLLGYK